MLVIDQSRNGDAAEVQAGEIFRVQLFENPTSGHRWQFTSPGDGALRIVEDAFEQSQDKPGAGGVRHWTLMADHPAVVRLQFERKRSWETQVAETFTITINVRAP
jgi:inhibitor of cysteine peptidase